MTMIEQTVAVLLCAGFSRRHPEGCKLMRELDGRPLVAHAAATIRGLRFRAHIAVVPPYVANAPLHGLLMELGYDLVVNHRRNDGQDGSIRIGVRVAASHGPTGILITLGDMPYVDERHLTELVQASAPDRPSASGRDDRRSPPCVFPKAFFPQLLDQHVLPRQIIARAETRVIATTPRNLADFDTAADFSSARKPRTRCSA